MKRNQIRSTLFGFFAAAYGAWMVMAGLGKVRSNLQPRLQPVYIVFGFMLFVMGAWSFYQVTIPPGGERMPLYAWLRYLSTLITLLCLGIAGFLYSSELVVVIASAFLVLSALWHAVKNFPRRARS